MDVGEAVTEVEKEVPGRAAVNASRGRAERRANGADGPFESIGQWMLERGLTREVHNDVTGAGRMSCATARAYC
jgi:membrane-bound lytic murein transglycosylase